VENDSNNETKAASMDLRFGEKEEALRAEVRSFLQQQLKDRPNGGELGTSSDEEFEFAKNFNSELAKRNWIAPAWPVEYGGLGANIAQQMVFNEEFGYYGAPDTGTRGFGVGMIGPTIIVHGTDEQKRNYLPKITSGEHIWCQGYSEPGAGSDLASLQTRAERDGDEFVINGQKIWTSGGHRANQMFCLVRTAPDAPKHRGISFLLIDDVKNTPGLTIRPLINMANRHHFNEVFFEDVRVPTTNIIGDENRGWYVAMTLLDFERSGIGATAGQRRTLERLTETLRSGPEQTRLSQRTELADLVVSNNVARYLGLRVASMQSKGLVPNYESSVIKVFQASLGQRIYNFGVGMLGLAGQLLPGEPTAPLEGELPENYMTSVPSTIAGGSNEIQRNIIATRGLGLPRG
jgi:alkylation response protein AidB-like acyl-CoA dehydrogenase